MFFFPFLSAAYAIVFFARWVFGAKQLPFTVCKVQNCLQRDTKPWKTIGSSNHTLYIFPSFRFSLFSFLSSSSGLVFDMISGSDEGDKVKDRQSYAGSQSTWQNARCRCAGVSGGASLRVKSVYKCEIKQRVKSVELLDIACRGIIGRVLECRAPPPLWNETPGDYRLPASIWNLIRVLSSIGTLIKATLFKTRVDMQSERT